MSRYASLIGVLHQNKQHYAASVMVKLIKSNAELTATLATVVNVLSGSTEFSADELDIEKIKAVLSKHQDGDL